MSDISELVINAVCTRINEKPAVYIPRITEQINELKDLTQEHARTIVNL